MTEELSRISPTADFPTYSGTRTFLTVIDGLNSDVFQSMWAHIWGQRGSPQENMDWTNPEKWIPERLSGHEQEIALHLWRKSNGVVNPRHMHGYWNLANRDGFFLIDLDKCFQITPIGQDFILNEESELISRIDQRDGILNLLLIISEHNPGKRGDFLPDFIQFCNSFTTYQSENVQAGALRDRMRNLIDRGFVNRSGISYSITDKGLAYLQKHADNIIGRIITTRQSELQKLASSITKESQEKLADFLSTIDPYKFEHLIRLLLEEMGYNNVTVTAPSNDKGVDVIADIELGISSVREVVQVKRHSGSINRPVLDQLRGSLHRFKAMRGTIITIGTFSPGAKIAALEPGAPPITLIDGNKLIDLLVQYEIGISKKSIEFVEFDKTRLLQFEAEEV